MLHDHRVLADADLTVFSGQDSTVQHAGASTDMDISDNDGRRCDVGGRVH